MECPGCQAQNREGARFCRECGAPFGAVCSSCGAKVQAASKFCDSCGTPLAVAPRPTGSALWEPYFLALLADVYAQAGQVEAGLATLDEALAAAQATGERWAEAELYRLRGSLLLQQTATPQAEAETWLRRALDVARRQEAKSLELRAAVSLSRLRKHQGKRKEAHDLLAEIYTWFTEGFDTADLQEAKALLEELA